MGGLKFLFIRGGVECYIAAGPFMEQELMEEAIVSLAKSRQHAESIGILAFDMRGEALAEVFTEEDLDLLMAYDDDLYEDDEEA